MRGNPESTHVPNPLTPTSGCCKKRQGNFVKRVQLVWSIRKY